MDQSFDARVYRDTLASTGETLLSAFAAIGPAEASKRPAPDKWAPVEIAGHMLDEERDDFRARIRFLFDDPTQPLPSIDPEGWIVQRRHIDRAMDELLEGFRAERGKSLIWLDQVVDQDWSVGIDHSRLGRLRAGDFLVSWAAHDLLHLSQLAKTRAELLAKTVAPYSTGYAMP